MQNIVSDFFKRLEHIVDTEYGGNISEFSRETGITRQYYNKMKRQHEGKLEGDPNPTLEVILKIIENTDVSPVWLLTGKEDANQNVQEVSERYDEYEALLGELSSSDIGPDEKIEFVASRLKDLLDFLDSGK